MHFDVWFRFVNDKAQQKTGPKLAWLGTIYSKVAVGFLLSVPFLLLLNNVRLEFVEPGSGLGPDPAARLVEYLGTWGIRILWLTLLLSSVSRLVKLPILIQHRRTFGLFAFGYLVLHFAAYFSALAGFDFNSLLEDFTMRPYIMYGLTGLGLLIPLAITSTRGWQRRLRRYWKWIHRLVYVVGVLGVIHVYMQEKAIHTDSFFYGSILFVLLLERAVDAIMRMYRKWKGKLAAT